MENVNRLRRRADQERRQSDSDKLLFATMLLMIVPNRVLIAAEPA